MSSIKEQPEWNRILISITDICVYFTSLCQNGCGNTILNSFFLSDSLVHSLHWTKGSVGI